MTDFLDKVKITDETDYSFQMGTIVEPYLEKRRSDGFFLSADGKKLHYEAYEKLLSRGSIIILHGFTESAEKFREISYYFRKAGYSVYVPDLRGHGLSYRTGKNSAAVEIDSFDTYTDDLDAFIKKAVLPTSVNKNIYIYSHSLGSTVALLYMIKHPYSIKKAVLSSPMICGNMGLPVPIASAASKLLCKFGGKSIPAPGRCVFNENPDFENSDTTSKARFLYYHEKRKKQPLYQTAGPAFSWVNASVEAKNRLLTDFPKRHPETELIIYLPEQDKQLLSQYTKKFADDADIKIKNIKGSKHEIFMSGDDVLKHYIEDILDYFE